MDKQLFVDIYNDKEFSPKVNAMLATMYRHSKRYFDDQAVDLDDFVQEMWCQLFEENTFTPDRAWCFEAIKHNAIDYIRNLKNRDKIAVLQSYEEMEGE